MLQPSGSLRPSFWDLAAAVSSTEDKTPAKSRGRYAQRELRPPGHDTRFTVGEQWFAKVGYSAYSKMMR